MRPPIPPFDPLGLPLPAFILQALAYLTFTLHLLAMQFTVGGAILLLINWLRSRRSADGSAAATAQFFGTGLPLGFSYLVTFGIPPLLFVQVIYGQFFYSSSVLIGAFWISVIPLLIAGYGSSYWHRLTRAGHPRLQPLFIGISLLVLFSIGFIYVNNLTLSMVPARWMTLYQAHPSGGTLNLGEPTLVPRYLLVLAPGLAVAGLALVIRAVLLRRWGKPDLAAASYRSGMRSMLVATVIEVLAAIGMWMTLPDNVRGALASGGVLTVLAVLGVVLGLLGLVLAGLSGKRVALTVPMLAGASQLGATAAMVVLRDFVRHEYLRPYFDLGAVTVHPQWGMFVLFAGVLVVGVVFLVVTTTKTVSALAAHRENTEIG
jgi:hypothetical protein